MIKFSVKKPLTIIVCVLVILALSIISFLKMTPDLLPSIDLPYMVVMTTYIGATPEEVEVTVTKPLEQSLATLEGLKTISSMSNANFSLVIMEFEQGHSMDAATVSTIQNVDQIKSNWPDMVGTPYIMKINPNMLPISIASIDKDDTSVQDLSFLLDQEILNKLEGIDGVASISEQGAVTSGLNVMISEEKVEELNKKLSNYISNQFSSGKDQILGGMAQIDSALNTIDDAKPQLEMLVDMLSVLNTVSQTIDEEALFNLLEENFGLTRDQIKEVLDTANLGDLNNISPEEIANGYNEAKAQLKELNNQEKMLVDQKDSLNSTLNGMEGQKSAALDASDLSATISIGLISSILQAENFSMPAGYIQDEESRFLVSVGDKVRSIDDIKDMLLFNFPEIGDVRLKDIADVFMSDNSEEVYGSINGNNAIILSFSKQSNYETATVSKSIQERFESLEEEYPGLHFTILMDQGDYIYLIVEAILQSLLYGALFSVIVLFLFLRDVRPTFITLLSIPISLTFAIVLMYFSGITINVISLSGLAVSVGMLVDNSIVVIENIFRFRRMGVAPKKAAIAGAKEVASAIVSSTLTTICVFVPILFVTGITKEIFLDMALTITYALVCSLLVALTLVPAISANILKKDIKEEQVGMVKFRDKYRAFLEFNLNHKALVLGVSLILFVSSIVLALSNGFIFIPDMSTPQMTGSLRMNDEESELEETRKVSDEAIKRMSEVEGVEKIGGMLSSSGMGALTGETSSSNVSLYIIVDQKAKVSGKDIADKCEEVCSDLPCEIEVLSSSSVTEYTSALGGSGVQVSLYSNDQDALKEAATIIAEKLGEVEGIKEVDDGLGEQEPEMHFVVNKDEAMKYNLTVAQVYMAVQEKLTKTQTSTEVSIDGNSYDIVIGHLGDTVALKEDIDELEIKYTDKDGKSGTVKLEDVAEISMKEALPTINRENQRTYLAVSGALEEGYNITNVTEEAKKALNGIELPAGVSFEFDGENEFIMDAMKDLALMLLIGIVLVYLIMVAQFQSFKSPFIIMFTIPLAFTGGLYALVLCNKEISIIAMIGFIILVGVIVNNGIVLVDYINQLRQTGHTKREAILTAGTTRIRPVLMTSITTILGLIIMAFGKTAGTDMMQPLALVAVGGLTYATLLTLLVVPVIYDVFNKEEYKAVTKDDLDITGLIAE